MKLYKKYNVPFYLLMSLIYISIVLIACNNNEIEHEVIAKEIYVSGSEDIPLITNSIISEDTILNEEILEENIIPIDSLLPTGYILLDYEIVNLNNDDFDEYVMVFFLRDTPEVYVLIASYDNNSSKYQFVWQSVTSSYNTNDVHIMIKDVTDDYYNEIIILGTVDQLKILDIFHMTSPSDILSFTNVFSLTATGIDFVEVNAPQYTEFSVAKLQNQIVVYNTNELDQIIREYYQWWGGRFNLISSTVFSSTDIVEEKLSQLYHSNNQGYQDFLNGAWAKKSSNNDMDILVVFSKEEDQEVVTIFDENHMFLYDWQTSYRQIPRIGGVAIHINLKSRLLHSIFDWMQVEIVSDDIIHIVGNESFPNHLSGEFHKIKSEDMLGEIYYRSRSALSQSLKTINLLEYLYGDFTVINSDNIHYLFTFPQLRIIDNEKESLAFYNIFDIDSLSILEIKHPDEIEFYLINKEKESITLIPISLYVDVYYKKQSEPILVLQKSIGN